MQQNYSENNFTRQQIENSEAKQRLNNEYLKLNGSANTEDTVGFFTKHNKIFQVLAVLFSAVGVYFDLLTLVGAIGSLAIGLAVGVFLEFGKHRLSRGLFNGSLDDLSRYGLVGGTLFIIMLVALLLHIRSINNFVGKNYEKQTNVIYQDELRITDATLKVNLELAKALNNKDKDDDVLSASGIVSSNKTLVNLRTSEAKNALLSSYAQSKNTIKGILYLLFLSVEFFSLFGIFGMLIIQRNTDKNVKSVVTTSDRLASVEANVYQAVETNMINTTLANVQAVMDGNNRPTLPTTTQQKEQIAFNANATYGMGTNTYFMGTPNQNTTKGVDLPIINKRKPTTSGTRTEKDHLKESLNGQNESDLEIGEDKRVLDLMLFSHKEVEFIKLLWDNGEVKEGDKLIPKRFILQQSVKGRETERELVNLYKKLEDMGLIVFKNGYRALADIQNNINVIG